jgi:hypothetical protein
MLEADSKNGSARSELLERLKLAHGEYRAEVSLGWDRQKLFLTLNPVLTALIASAAHKPLAARLSLTAAALTAIAGALLVRRSHGRYLATRVRVHAIEDQLGIADLQTTGGQRVARDNARLERFRVVDIVVFVFIVTALLDVTLAVLW